MLDESTSSYQDILSSLFKLMEEEEIPSSIRTSKAMFDAAKSGNVMILKFLLKCNPNESEFKWAKLTSHCYLI